MICQFRQIIGVGWGQRLFGPPPYKIIVGGGCSLLPHPVPTSMIRNSGMMTPDRIAVIICLHEMDSINLSRDMRFPIMWYARPAKPQISLRKRAVWSEPLLVAWMFYDCWATDWTLLEVSKFKRTLHWLVWVYTCPNTTLLEITCHG